MSDITRASLLMAAAAAMDKLPREALNVPELGGTIYVRAMTGKERDAFEESLRIRKGRRKGETDLTNFRARLATYCIVDANGARLLDEVDAEVLGALPSGVLDRIINVINRLSGRTDEEAEELGNGSASLAASDVPSSN